MTTKNEGQSYFIQHLYKIIAGFIILVIISIFLEEQLIKKEFGLYLLGFFTVTFILYIPILYLSSNIANKMENIKEYTKDSLDEELEKLSMATYKISYLNHCIDLFCFLTLNSLLTKGLNFSSKSGFWITFSIFLIIQSIKLLFFISRSLDEKSS